MRQDWLGRGRDEGVDLGSDGDAHPQKRLRLAASGSEKGSKIDLLHLHAKVIASFRPESSQHSPV